jgi:hypothetical protein
MRKRYIWDEKQNKLVPYEEYERPLSPQLILDIDQTGQTYQSPVTMQWIDSRTKMREDLKVSGCRQVDPGERESFNNYRKSNGPLF